MLKTKLAKKTNKSYEDIHYSCTIRFLDDSEPLTVTYQKDSKGQWLLDYVCKELNLVERDYFGLRYVDSEKQRHWLDPTKTVYRQLKNVNPMVLCFRVKFYPSDPMKLKEEITRYFLFLQLRRDLHHGRLLCSPSDANELAGYIIQSEVGDYDPQDHPPGYISQFKMLPKQTQKQEEKIAEFHKKFRSQVPAEAEANFLKKAATLETYGVDPHPVKDQKGNQMYLGITHLGIVTFQGNKRTHLFKWPQITKIAFEGKMFIVHVIINEVSCKTSKKDKKKHACGFKCATFSACKHLWKCAVEQQYFFTLSSSSEAKKVTSGGSFFSRGSKFRFSGRCQREVFNDSAEISREEPNFVRSSSNPAFVRSYDKLRTASLPNKFRDRSSMSEISNMMGENNHTTLDSLLATSTPLEDPITETIPEEGALELGDSPYRPMRSPSAEDLPSLPIVEAPPVETPDVETPKAPAARTTEPLISPAPVPADLDEQIQKLQKELESCRKSSGDQTAAEPVPSGGVSPVEAPVYNEKPVDVQQVKDNNEPDRPAEVPAPRTPTPPLPPASAPATPIDEAPQPTTKEEKEPELAEPSKEPCRPAAAAPTKPPDSKKAGKNVVCLSVSVAVFIALAMFVTLTLLVLESDLQIPVLRDLRQLPEVQNFKRHHYLPLKSALMWKK